MGEKENAREDISRIIDLKVWRVVTRSNFGDLCMGVDLDQKVGGQNRKIIGSKNLVFLNLQKRQKSKFWGFYFFLFVLQFIVLIKFNFIF